MKVPMTLRPYQPWVTDKLSRICVFERGVVLDVLFDL